MFLVSSPTSRSHRNWQAGDAFTINDASELYEVERWGKGYFSVSPSGHMVVHPTKDPSRSIDLKQLTDHLLLRGIELRQTFPFRCHDRAVASGHNIGATERRDEEKRSKGLEAGGSCRPRRPRR